MRAPLIAAEADAGAPLYLRLPPLDAPDALDALARGAALRPLGFALTHAAGGADVQRLGARLAVEEARLGLAEGTFRILAFVTESAQAIGGLSSYVGASARLEAMIWTLAPLGAALARRSASPQRLARDLTLIGARAAGVFALDAPFADLDDLDGLRVEAREAAQDGFDGKVALSGPQAAVIHEAFAQAR